MGVRPPTPLSVVPSAMVSTGFSHVPWDRPFRYLTLNVRGCARYHSERSYQHDDREGSERVQNFRYEPPDGVIVLLGVHVGAVFG